MKPKYLYIDDEDPKSLESIVNGFNDLDEIKVVLVDMSNYKSFEDLKKESTPKSPSYKS